MANILHIQPATLSRILKKLVRQEIIEIETAQVTILKKSELKKVFNGAD